MPLLKIQMDGSKLLSVTRDEAGMHIYIEEGRRDLKTDKIYTVRNFEPKDPLIELLLPTREKMLLTVTALLSFLDRSELVRVFAEYERLAKTELKQ